eukprot:5655868-Prymnesium_polylepis.1
MPRPPSPPLMPRSPSPPPPQTAVPPPAAVASVMASVVRAMRWGGLALRRQVIGVFVAATARICQIAHNKQGTPLAVAWHVERGGAAASSASSHCQEVVADAGG